MEEKKKEEKRDKTPVVEKKFGLSPVKPRKESLSDLSFFSSLTHLHALNFQKHI